MSSGMNGIDWFKDRSLKHGWVICLQCLQRFGWTKVLYADILWIQQNDHQAKLTQLRCNLSELAVESQSESLCHSWGNGGASNACPPLLLDYLLSDGSWRLRTLGEGRGRFLRSHLPTCFDHTTKLRAKSGRSIKIQEILYHSHAALPQWVQQRHRLPNHQIPWKRVHDTTTLHHIPHARTFSG